VATVQNRYNLVDRDREDVLSHCAANSIGFIPWFPLAAGELTRPGRLVDRIASAHGATTGQVALAWLVQRSPVILPITGTLRVAHLEENVAAAGLSLTSEEMNSTGSQICYPVGLRPIAVAPPTAGRSTLGVIRDDAQHGTENLFLGDLAHGTRGNVGAAVVHEPAARIAACGRFRSDGAPARNHGAIMLSNIMQPNAELGMNGQMGLPQK
jgi:hypothetical protein